MAGRRGLWIDANESDGLHYAVDDTGGRVALGAAAAADALEGAAEDLESYYSLGFPSESLAAGKSLAVDLRVDEPGARVRTRRSVVQRGALDRAGDRIISNHLSSAPARGFPLEARITSRTPRSSDRVRVTYEVAIPAAQLVFLPVAGGRAARIAGLVAILDRGELTQPPPVQKEFRISDDAPAGASHVTFTGEAFLGYGATISIGILDEATQEAGFARIDVPAAAKR